MRFAVGIVILVPLSVTLTASAEGPELVPPRLIHIDDFVLPEGAAREVELTIQISADGAGTVEVCELDVEVCGILEEVVRTASFEPARRDAEAIPSRIRLRLHASEPTPQVIDSEDEAPLDVTPPLPEVALDVPRFGARATAHRLPAGTRRFELRELRDAPGAFGDPFRALESLPGVVPVMTGLPMFYLRGSPPASTQYVYDDLPLPMLFHFGIGPGVVHPRMLGPLRLHAGIAPARYGRHTGGVVVAEGPDERAIDRPAGEIELRLLDLNGYVEAPVLGGAIAAAGRIGYPGLLISAFTNELTLQYYDYQFRGHVPVGDRTELRLVWLGSYDQMTMRDAENTFRQDVTVQFHRGELRLVRDLGRGEFGVALRAGFEESGILRVKIRVTRWRLAR